MQQSPKNDKVTSLIARAEGSRNSEKRLDYSEIVQSSKIWNGQGYSVVQIGDIVKTRGGIISDTEFKITSVDGEKVVGTNTLNDKEWKTTTDLIRTGNTIDLCLPTKPYWRPAFMGESITVDVDQFSQIETWMNNHWSQIKSDIKNSKPNINGEVGTIEGVKVSTDGSQVLLAVVNFGSNGIHDLPVFWIKPSDNSMIIQLVANHVTCNMNNNNNNSNDKLSMPDLQSLEALEATNINGNDGTFEYDGIHSDSSIGDTVYIRKNLLTDKQIAVESGLYAFILDKDGSYHKVLCLDSDIVDNQVLIKQQDGDASGEWISSYLLIAQTSDPGK